MQDPLRRPPQVDLLGVVTATGPLGSIKRQRDNTEVPRRDLTLADQRCAQPLERCDILRTYGRQWLNSAIW